VSNVLILSKLRIFSNYLKKLEKQILEKIWRSYGI
jgi:hypothetical protein